MRYVTHIERMGIKKGREQGLEKGREQGLQQEAHKLIALMLKTRFGAIPKWAEEKLSDAATDELENWGVRLISAKKIEDVFA